MNAPSANNAGNGGGFSLLNSGRDQVTQGNEFDDWSKTTEGQRFIEKWLGRGQDFTKEGGGWEAIKNSHEAEAFADLLGLTGEFKGIPGWYNLYKNSGLDLDNPDLSYDDRISMASDWFWNGPRTVWVNELLSNPNFDLSLLGSGNDFDNSVRYLFDLYGLADEIGKYYPTLDINDLVSYAYASALSNNSITANLADVERIAANSGEDMEFGLLENGYEDQGSYRTNPRKYSLVDLAKQNPLAPYDDIVDPQIIDTYLAYLNAPYEQRKYGVKSRS